MMNNYFPKTQEEQGYGPAVEHDQVRQGLDGRRLHVLERQEQDRLERRGWRLDVCSGACAQHPVGCGPEPADQAGHFRCAREVGHQREERRAIAGEVREKRLRSFSLNQEERATCPLFLFGEWT